MQDDDARELAALRRVKDAAAEWLGVRSYADLAPEQQALVNQALHEACAALARNIARSVLAGVDPQPPKRPPKATYKVVQMPVLDEAALNALGAEGWLLVAGDLTVGLVFVRQERSA